MSVFSPSWVEISSSKLLSNISFFRQLLDKETKMMAIVKANAYGHDLVKITKIITPVIDWLGVSSLNEGLVVRSAGFRGPVLVLRNLFPEELHEAMQYNLSFAVFNKLSLTEVIKETERTKTKARVHLKLETGTNRLGSKQEELLSLIKMAKNNKRILFEGVYTHFANIEDTADASFLKEQLAKFGETFLLLEKMLGRNLVKHTACTAAILKYPQTHFDLVRLGIGLYGLGPKLKQALSWKAKILQIKRVVQGETIGYGRSFVAGRDMIIGVLPVGYYDGFSRHLSNEGRVLVRGKFAAVVGRICMNLTMVDLTGIGNVKEGEIATLLGQDGNLEITADEIASATGTINYEIVSRINPQLPRIVV